MPKSSPFRLRPWADKLAAPDKLSENVAAALGRIGQSADGRLVVRFLRTHYLEAVPPVGTGIGALRDYEAARRIASSLIKGLERKANDGSRSSSDDNPS